MKTVWKSAELKADEIKALENWLSKNYEPDGTRRAYESLWKAARRHLDTAGKVEELEEAFKAGWSMLEKQVPRFIKNENFIQGKTCFRCWLEDRSALAGVKGDA